MKHAIVLLACALTPFTLAACSSEPAVDARNASAEEVADKLAAAGGSDMFVRAGKWQSRVQIEQFELPGAPAGMSNAMRGMMERTSVQESCLTPQEAKRPKEDFFAGKNKDCRYDRFTMANGKIDAVMRCTSDGKTHNMTMQGTYNPDAYQMRMTMKADAGAGAGAEGGLNMTMRVDAKRTGECDGKTA